MKEIQSISCEYVACIIFLSTLLGLITPSQFILIKHFEISLIFKDRKPDIRTETSSQGSKILIIDGHRYHRYGGRKQKVSFMCHAYKTLG